jgi:hypothetical protein
MSSTSLVHVSDIRFDRALAAKRIKSSLFYARIVESWAG